MPHADHLAQNRANRVVRDDGQTPRADIRGIRSRPNFVQPAQARNYAQHLRDLAIQWDAAADLYERLRAEAPTGPVDQGTHSPCRALRKQSGTRGYPARAPDLAASRWQPQHPDP